MSPQSRRSVLRYSGVVLGCASAGCGLRSSPVDTPPRSDTPTRRKTSPGDEFDVETPAQDECSTVILPQPTPTDEGLEPRGYPSLPNQLTRSSAIEFAVAFEKAYQYNMFLASDFIPGTDEVRVRAGVPDGTVTKTSAAYIIGLNGRIQTADTVVPTDQLDETETPTSAPSSTTPFSAWYHVSTQSAVRDVHEDDRISSEDSPRFDSPVTVACKDT